MKSIFLFLWLTLISCSVSAQLVPACAGGSPATTCANACINCNFNGYSGSTAGYPSGIVPNFCGTVENAQWMGFIAGAGNATFTVIPSNCSNGDGLQIALYEDCMGEPLKCEKGEENGGNLPVSINASIAPGHNYFLMIDGFAGDQCDFSVTVSPNNAVYEPPLGQIGQLTGPDKMCPGATMPFEIPPVFGAGAYIWSGPPGSMIDSMPLPVTVLGNGGTSVNITLGDVGGDICVQAANSCNQTPACGASLTVEILDASYRPTIEADTLQHLSCSGAPAELTAKVSASVGFSFAWTADSSGHIYSGPNTLRPKVDQLGVYTLLVINGQNGCSSSVAVQVGPPDTPHISDLRVQHITCYGDENGVVNAAAVEGGKSPFLFSLDGAPYVYAPTFRYLQPGPHILGIESADGCRSDTSFSLTQPDEFQMDLGLDTSIHLGRSLQLWSSNWLSEPLRAAQILVKPAELQPMLCDTCQYAPTYSFHYTVTAIDSNGCEAADDRTVAVSKERYVFVPNVFKPGSGDTSNEVFGVFGGEDVELIERFRVVNRWGNIVHERSDFLPNDGFSSWDGKIEGEPANPAVFTWQAQIRFKDGITEWKSGTVTLVR